MPIASVRRLCAAVAVFAAMLATGAAPAWAADPPFTGIVPQLTVPVSATAVTLAPEFRHISPKKVTLTDWTVTFELGSGLTGVSLLPSEHTEDQCVHASPARLVCSAKGAPTQFDDRTVYGFFTARVRAGAGATAGETGGVTVTLSSTGQAPVVAHGKIRVADEVQLVAGPGETFRRDPGQAVDVPLTVSVAGDRAADGAALRLATDYAFTPTAHYSNCLYWDLGPTTCWFDQQLQAGATYTAALPYKIRPDTEAKQKSINDLTWMTRDQLADYRAYLNENNFGDLGYPSKGPVLKLTKVAGTAGRARAALQADPDLTDNATRVEVLVGGKNEADIQADGNFIAGSSTAVGEPVSLSLGFEDLGPAALDTTHLGYLPAYVDVTIPPGTTATFASDGCVPFDRDGVPDPASAGKPGFTSYSCTDWPVLALKTYHTFAIGLRVDKVVPNAKSTIVVNGKCQCHPQRYTKDPNLSNNTRTIVLNPTGGTGTGSGGEGGGGLPNTGPAGAIWIAGVALLLAGAAGVLFARRRRTRFTV